MHFTVDGSAIAATTTTDASGHWTFRPTGLADGSHTVVARETNGAGNPTSESLTFTLDTTAPVVTERLANDTGSSSADRITSDPTLTGTGDANAVVHFTVDGGAIAATTTADASGNWTFRPFGLADGTHTVVASETDAAGNAAGASLTFALNNLPSTLQINCSWDNSVNSAPPEFKGSVLAATQTLASYFSDPVKINLHVGYGEVANIPLPSGVLGANPSLLLNCHYDTYTNIRNALAYHATSADDFSSLASLPANPSDTTLYPVSMAEAAALGLISPDSVIDAYVGFGSNVPFDYAAANGGSTSVPSGQYDFLGVLSHEVTEIMGRVLLCGAAPPGGGPAQLGPLDIFYYSSPGVGARRRHSPADFSPDGGVTNLGDFNTNSNGDAGDWATSDGSNAFSAFRINRAVALSR